MMHRETRLTQSVVLTVGRSADTGEMITVNNTLEATAFGSTDNINVLHIICNDIGDGDGVSKLELTLEVSLKLNKLALRVVPPS